MNKKDQIMCILSHISKVAVELYHSLCFVETILFAFKAFFSAFSTGRNLLNSIETFENFGSFFNLFLPLLF